MQSKRQTSWVLSMMLLSFPFVGGALALAGPSIFQFLYLPVLFLLGVILYRYDIGAYFELMLACWFYNPMFRRMVEWKIGYSSKSVVGLAPLILSALCVTSLFKASRRKHAHILPALVVISLALTYAYVVGIFNNGLFAATYDLGGWMIPVFTGYAVLFESGRIHDVEPAIRRAFMRMVVISGAYGVYQFVRPPGWDVTWVLNAKVASIGIPAPFLIRVFGTMNAPGTYALAIMCGLILAFIPGGKKPLWGQILGYGGFLLSMVRSAWGGWIIAVGRLFSGFSGARRLMILVGLLLAFVAYQAALFYEPVERLVAVRVASLGRLEEDRSFNIRKQIYLDAISDIFNDPMGQGLGNIGLAAKLSDAPKAANKSIDAGPVAFILSLGWLGTALYLIGAFMLYFSVARPRKETETAKVYSAGYVAMCAQLVFFNVFNGGSGVFLWMFLGVALAMREADMRMTYSGHLASGNGTGAESGEYEGSEDDGDDDTMEIVGDSQRAWERSLGRNS